MQTFLLGVVKLPLFLTVFVNCFATFLTGGRIIITTTQMIEIFAVLLFSLVQYLNFYITQIIFLCNREIRLLSWMRELCLTFDDIKEFYTH